MKVVEGHWISVRGSDERAVLFINGHYILTDKTKVVTSIAAAIESALREVKTKTLRKERKES